MTYYWPTGPPIELVFVLIVSCGLVGATDIEYSDLTYPINPKEVRLLFDDQVSDRTPLDYPYLL